jgi:hypothetical protein
MPTRAEALAQERNEDAERTLSSVDRYAAKYPKHPLGPFPNFEAAEAVCALALADDRELTRAERTRVEWQDGDDIAGSEF